MSCDHRSPAGPVRRSLSTTWRFSTAVFCLLPVILAVSCTSSDDGDTVATAAGEAATELPGDVQAISLLGDTLRPLPLSDEARSGLESDLAEARAAYEASPDDADAIIWLGRRLAYLGRYREALQVFGEGLEKHPDDPRMYRHRGHRWISVREFDRAIEDLSRAAELIEGTEDRVEPDGAPNPSGIPRSTLHSNIWYHLGLAHYLRHDFRSALDAYLPGLEVSDNDDMYVATADWLYMTYRRLGMDREAAALLETVSEDMEILENESYHKRLLMYQGVLEPESLLSEEDADALTLATQGYGVGNWHLYNGDTDRALRIFRQVLDTGYWPAFGYIAAESELAALGE